MDANSRVDGRGIYREASLEKLASPDRLDALVRIVDARSWIAVLALAVGLALVVAWSLLGRVPSTAVGSAILVKPKQVIAFQSAAAGMIRSIEVSVGDVVQPGQLLARLRLPVLEEQLEQERIELEQHLERSRRMTDLEKDMAERERHFVDGQRELLEKRMADVGDAAERFRQRADLYLEQQRRNLATSRSRAKELADALTARYDARKALFEEGHMAVDQLLDIRSRVIDSELRLADLDVEEYEVELRAESVREDHDERMDTVQDLGIRVNDLGLREMDIDRRLLEDELTAATEEHAIRRRIEELETRLDAESRVVHTGRYGGGSRARPDALVVGRVHLEDPAADLMGLAYFEVKSGKKIEVSQRIRITPSTVERERSGSIVGRVVACSDYPVTIAAAANEIGDLEVARTLLRGESRIEVLVALDRDPAAPSGFAWTSGLGPANLPITAGTTGDARVTIEERAPIRLVLPFLRSVTGL